MSRGAFIFALLFVAILVGIAWMKSHGAVEEPVLVEAPVHQADANAPPAWRLMTLCPVGRRNIPTLPDDRRA